MIHRLLKTWYKQIPAMACEPGCHACCEGFAPAMLKEEWYRLNHPGKLSLVGQPLTSCPFLAAAGCEIYAQRPMICRIFGTVSRAELASLGLENDLGICCPRGCEPRQPLGAAAALRQHGDYLKHLQQQLQQAARDYQQWYPLAAPAEELRPKFQWLQYVLATAVGRMIYANCQSRPKMAPVEAARMQRLQGLLAAPD